MTNDPVTDFPDPRMQRAITEIEGLITSRYPGTTFAVTRNDDPPGIRVLATVDVDDIEEVLDLYIHRLTQLQVDEELPLYVIPVQTPERLRRLLATSDVAPGGPSEGAP